MSGPKVGGFRGRLEAISEPKVAGFTVQKLYLFRKWTELPFRYYICAESGRYYCLEAIPGPKVAEINI